MERWGYLVIASLLIFGLLLLFFFSYYLNKKTPVPKGCEDLKISKENCASCNNHDCELRKKDDIEN